MFRHRYEIRCSSDPPNQRPGSGEEHLQPVFWNPGVGMPAAFLLMLSIALEHILCKDNPRTIQTILLNSHNLLPFIYIYI